MNRSFYNSVATITTNTGLGKWISLIVKNLIFLLKTLIPPLQSLFLAGIKGLITAFFPFWVTKPLRINRIQTRGNG